MSDLDRRVAVEIMGIKEPRPPLVFRPPLYSTSLEYAMKALKMKLRDLGGRVHLAIDEQGVVAWDAWGNRGVPGEEIPEAICNLLLVLTEEE